MIHFTPEQQASPHPLTREQIYWLQLELQVRFGFPMPRAERWVQRGRCPCCGHRALYYFASSPTRVRCNRQNKCGFEITTRALFPDVFGGPDAWKGTCECQLPPA